MKKSPAKKSGFTLIEIVIVLAIAALIMVIVFVAVQGAQRSRRDTDRRAAASRVLTSLVSCASDNSGKIGGSGITCATYISGATTGSAYTGSGDLVTSATQPSTSNKDTITGGATATVTSDCPTTWTTQASAVSGKVCAYYWSEASQSVVVLSSAL